jgi:DNA-binding transcriptional regulator YiaG
MLRLSQVGFARELGVDSSVVAAYENYRSPVQYGLTWEACRLFRLSANWLMTGVGGSVTAWPLPSPQFVSIDPKTPISRAWVQGLKSAYETDLESPKRTNQSLPFTDITPDPEGRLFAGEFLSKTLMETLIEVPDSNVVGVAAEISRMLGSLQGGRQRDAPEIVAARYKEIEKARAKLAARRELLSRSAIERVGKVLTDTEIRSKSVGVKSQMPNLLARLDKATKETGKKSALAEFLGVPLASVSRWLSGDREPGGEITLKMLRWVELQEQTSK